MFKTNFYKTQKHTMHEIIKFIFIKLRGHEVLRVFNKAQRILFWHGIDNRVDPNVEQEIFDVDVFKKQLDYLQKHYEIISIEEFEQRFKNNDFSNREIVLTFDDGYKNNLKVVLPILKKRNLPFTVFISTEHITTGELFPTSIARIIIKGAFLKEIRIPSKKLFFNLSSDISKDMASKEIGKLMETLPLEQVKQIAKDLKNNVTEDKWIFWRQIWIVHCASMPRNVFSPIILRNITFIGHQKYLKTVNLR